MKKQSNRRGAFLDPYRRTSLFVFLASIALVILANAFAQPGHTNVTRNIVQKQRVKVGVQQPDQNFWAQTNGPQGGDGIALASNASGDLFVGTQGGGVFRSTDNGGTWTGVSNGLTDTNVRALAINGADHIFAGTFSGVFRSTTMGTVGRRLTTAWNFRSS